jgi:hypothetical protein
MKLEVGKDNDGNVFCRFDKPHKMREMNIVQLRKLFKRTARYSPVLAQSVNDEINRRTGKNLEKVLAEPPKETVISP